MPLYMTQFAYAREAWPALMENPQRLAGRLVDALEKKLGGRLVHLSFCFGLGEFDGVLIFEAPDDTAATAVLVASIASSAHIRAATTTKLLTAEEFGEALRRAASVRYEGPPAAAGGAKPPASPRPPGPA